MSRNNTPSILSTLTAYDSSSDEAEPDENDLNESIENKGGQVTVFLPPEEKQSVLPPPVISIIGALAHNYEDEENFDYKPPEHEEDEKMQEDNNNRDDDDYESNVIQTGGGEIITGEYGLVTSSKMDMDSNGNSNDMGANEGDESDKELKRKKRREWLLAKPEGTCPPSVQKHFEMLYRRKVHGGLDMNQKIHEKKAFRNPSIYEKLIDMCDIDEFGTNFEERMNFDPSSYYDELDKAQRNEMERRMKDKKAKENVKVDFVSGTAKKLPESIAAAVAAATAAAANAAAAAVPRQPSAYIRAFGSLAFKN